MSLVASAKHFVLCCFLLALLGGQTLAVEVVGDNPTWNYDKNGADWDFANCNVTTTVQSPYPMVAGTPNIDYYPWT